MCHHSLPFSVIADRFFAKDGAKRTERFLTTMVRMRRCTGWMLNSKNMNIIVWRKQWWQRKKNG